MIYPDGCGFGERWDLEGKSSLTSESYTCIGLIQEILQILRRYKNFFSSSKRQQGAYSLSSTGSRSQQSSHPHKPPLSTLCLAFRTSTLSDSGVRPRIFLQEPTD